MQLLLRRNSVFDRTGKTVIIKEADILELNIVSCPALFSVHCYIHGVSHELQPQPGV
jgi:hypothetical protein